ncbi:hypothetical protein NUW54_g14471 [Trametes sanguinea]|uniref:Uncharacterized protein n=1 Tax=Trametes sanguinea TaxID=158606 RepID=A0ACC1MD22_9APHY|nr:hypothetical protein NUW54_g14471 [Trametes sanguinea]
MDRRSAVAWRRSKPIPVPISPDISVTARLETLNNSLLAWGFDDDVQNYVAAFKETHRRAKEDGCMTAWVSEREEWLARGDVILDDIEELVGGGALECFAAESMCELWRHISAAAFKAQYMMVVTQVYLDLGL